MKLNLKVLFLVLVLVLCKMPMIAMAAGNTLSESVISPFWEITNVDIVTLVLGAILGGIVSFAFDRIYEKSSFALSPYSGEWRDELYDATGTTILKRNRYHLSVKRKNGTISGTIERYYPEAEVWRKWFCSGVISNDQILLSYWSTDPTSSSRGCIVVKLNTTRPNDQDHLYTGKYMKYVGNKVESYKINLIKKDR